MKLRKPSLARQLLRRLLPLVVLVILAGGAVSYVVAHKAATVAYDRALMDSALAIADHVEVVNGALTLQLPKAAREILLTDTYDKIFYEVIDIKGKTIAGSHGLPRPSQIFDNGKVYYDGRFKTDQVRVAALLHELNGISFIVLSAETALKRNFLASEILLAMLIPELLLIVLAFFMMRRSVRQGLASIEPLRAELVSRTHADLSPLPLQNIPEEIHPIFKEINDLLKRLSAALEAKRDFVADASHQLRTPIATLQAEAEMALNSADPRQELNKIVAATRRITHLAHQLLTLSRIEYQTIQSVEIVNLAELIKNAAYRWLPLALQQKIDLGFELTSASVMGNAVWLEELTSNLVDNALRYSKRGGRVTIRCHQSKKGAQIEIEDNGPGIPLEEREKVFDRFYRLGNTGVDGCGLGLAIVWEVARNHNATITIEDTTESGGALVRLCFPNI